MTIEAQLPDGRILEFPDGTSPAVIQAAAKRILANPMAGKSTAELEAAPSAPTSVGDIFKSLSSGIVGGGKSLVDVFGAGSGLSQGLGEAQDYLQRSLTPQRQEEIARRQELENRAAQSGSLFKEAKAFLGGVAEAPLQSLAQAAGSSAPSILTGIAALPLEAPAALALGVGTIAKLAVGALQGVGEYKGSVFDAVKAEYVKQGKSPAEAERLAEAAQQYSRDKAFEIGGSAVLGALDAVTGVEPSAAKAMRKVAPTGALTKEAIDAGIKALPEKALKAPTYGKQFLKGIAEEAPLEGAQGAFGQYGQNVALQQAGADVSSPMEGVLGAGLRDAAVGALFGGVGSPMGMKSARQEFATDQFLRQAKAQQELEQQKADALRQKEETRAKTEEGLGVPKMLALPAPAKEAEQEKDPLQNPVGRVTEDELGKAIGSNKVVNYIKAYRKENGLPPLKSYSIEDIKDAMTAQNPEGEEGALNAILAYKTNYQNETYTPEDIMNRAVAKNVATETKGWNDFLTRATGKADLNTMTQPELHSVASALDALKRTGKEEQLVLPEGSNAARFTQEQYNQGVTHALMDVKEGKPVTLDQAREAIKAQTDLKTDRDADHLLKTAAANEDLIVEKGTGFQAVSPGGTVLGTYGSEAEAKRKHRRADILPIETQLVRAPEEVNAEKAVQLPEGYEIQKKIVAGEAVPAAYVVREDGSQTNASQTFAEEVDAKDRLNVLTRKREANAAAEEAAADRIRKDLEKRQSKIAQMEADGQTDTAEHKNAVAAYQAANVAGSAKITDHLDKAEAFRKPLKVVPLGKKTAKVEKHTVIKQGKETGTFADRAKAEQHVLTSATEDELKAIAERGGVFGKRAETELQDRQRTEPGIKVKGTAEGLEAAGVHTPEVQAKLKELEAKLVPMLKKFGLEKVGLNVVRAIENDAEGAWGGLNNLIRIAFNATNPIKTMRHEALHALKDLGFFTDAQWEALKRQAEKTWVDKYLKGVAFNDTMSRFDAYTQMGLSKEAILEEAIADAFGDFEAAGKAPVGMLDALFKRLQQFFSSLRQALTGAGFESADDIFGKIERGELKAGKETAGTETRMSLKQPSQENAWKADEQTIKAADKFEEENGIRPYVSEGFLDLPTDGTKYSLQKYNPEKHLSFDAALGVPINKDGLITLYYHTTKEKAVQIGNKKVIPSEGRNRVYLTNESNGADVLNNRGNFDQELDGSTVLVYVHPDILQVDAVQENGRRDFFIPLAQGDFFNKKMKLQSIQKSRTSAITETFSYNDHEKKIADAVAAYKNASPADRRKLVAAARNVLKQEHNVGSLLSENGKLEKTRVGDYNLDWEGNSVASMGLGLASAQQISDKVSTCPRSAICEGLCLGETSGGNFMFGGAASEDVGDIKKSSFRAAARMMQYLKTEALIVHPEEFATVLQAEIDSLAKWCASETQNKRDPETKKNIKVEKEIYQPAVRLNVTSDFKPSMFRAIIEGNPDTMFYDYTKLGSEPIAPNHHLTYSSTGFGQIIDGKKVFFKDKSGKYDHNWATMRSRLNNGQNVAMAFSSKSGIPSFLVDEETGVQYRVWNGDDYDARFLDPKQPDGKGMIIGLKNKAGNLSEKNATEKTGGFFVQYDPKTDGDTVVVPKQSQFKGLKDVAVTTAKYSLRGANLQKFLEPSKEKGIWYHGTARDISEFKPKQANAIFLTKEPDFASSFAAKSRDYMILEAATKLDSQKIKKMELLTRFVEDAIADKRLATAENSNGLFKNTREDYVNKFMEMPMRQVLNTVGIGTQLSDYFARGLETGQNIMPVYVQVKNPFDYQNSRHITKLLKEVDLEDGVIDSLKDGDWWTIESDEVQEGIQAAGFDGFYVKEHGYENLAVYSSSQIKSATGNRGTFDAANPDIRYSLPTYFPTAEEAENAAYQKAPPSTPEFKRFFGASKVKEEGRPQVMYHGSLNEFDQFNEDNRKGLIFVTPNPAFAEEYALLHASRMEKQEEPPVKVYPLWVRAETPFDYENPDHVAKVMNEFGGTMGMSEYTQTEKEVKEGNWAKIEDPRFVATLKKLGFDSLYVKENKTKNLAVFKANQVKSVTGNIGEFGENKNIKYSLPVIPAAAAARRDETTQAREHKGFIERITDAFKPESLADLRASFIHRYNRLGFYDQKLAEKMGGKVMLADVSAEAAANMSDLSASVTYAAFGIGNRKGGIPVYKNGMTTIDTSVRGPLEILSPLAQFNDPKAYQDYQYWAGVKRGSRFMAETSPTGVVSYREKNFDKGDIALSEQVRQAYLAKGVDFNAIQKEMNIFNDGLVDYMKATGVLAPERAAEFKRHMDYIPFYRQLNGEDTVGPKIFNSISGVKPPKKLKGSEAPLTDYLESIVQNTQAAINAGMKNMAAQRAINVALQLGPIAGAQRLNTVSSAPDTVQVLENGKQVSYRVADQLFINAVKSLNMAEIPFMGFFSAPSNLLRNLVTKDPGFMLANLARDSLSAWITSGSNATPLIGTAANFAKALGGKDKNLHALYNAGILGGYEFSSGVIKSGEVLEKDLSKKYGSAGIGSPLKVFKGVWDALEHATEASDAATRMAVYERVLEETGNETEALYRALEVMNFNRKGSSPVVRILTAAIPFLNARVQGLDVFYRTAFGQNVSANAKEMQKAFFVRGATLMALSAAYFLAVSDDDEWKKQEQETKDNYWILPGVGKFPTPFEVGFLFKTMPERIMAYTMKDDTGQDFMQSMQRGLLNTFAFNPIPQIAKPIIEYNADYNFFTGRPIVGQGMQGVEAPYQVGPNTTKTAEALGKALGMSPLKLDQLISSYTGTMGLYAMTAIDAVLDTQSDSPHASKRFEQLPIIKRFAADPEARGNITQYYELKKAVDAAVQTENLLLKAGKAEEFADFMEKNAGLLATKQYVANVEKSMKQMREMRKMIQGAEMSADEKRDTLTAIGQAENNLNTNIQTIKKMVSEF